MKIRIKLATFREYQYHVEGHPPTGTSGVYGELCCSACGRVYRDKGCTELDITNPGGWYAAQIDCVCKKNFIQYEGHEVYVADVEKAIIKDIPKKEVKPVRVKSKYADVLTHQCHQHGPRQQDYDEINCEVALKNQICKRCGASFMIEGIDEDIDALIENDEPIYEVYCSCSANIDGGYSIIFDMDDAQNVYHFGEEDEEEADTSNLDTVTENDYVPSIYGDVSCILFIAGEEADFELDSDKLSMIVCENCQSSFMTPDIDRRINIMVDNEHDIYEIHCTHCDEPGNFLVLDYDEVERIKRKRTFEQGSTLAKSIISTCDTYKVSHRLEIPEPKTSIEDAFFSEVDPDGLESSFFKA